MSQPLSAREGDLLAHIAVAAGMLLPQNATRLSTLEASDQRTCKRLAKKGFVELVTAESFRITQAGLERSKQIY